MRDFDPGRLLAAIAATTHDCVLGIDLGGVVVWTSPATRDLLGWAPADLLGQDLGTVLPGDLRLPALERLRAGERVESFVDVAVRRDGGTVRAEVSLGVIDDADGGIAGFVVIVRDVTAQLREQRELALALQVARAHFDQAPTPQALLDLRGRVRSANPAWCDLFGQGEPWFADVDLLALVPPVEPGPATRALALLESGERDSLSYHGRLPDGSGRGGASLVIDATLLRDTGGRPHAVAASVREYAGMGTADQQPEEARSLAEVLASRSWDSAIVLDADAQVVHISPAVGQMLGYGPDHEPRPIPWEYVHPADASLAAELLRRMLTEQRRQEHAVLRFQDAQQRWRWIEVTATNCLTDPAVRGIVANLRDVTEQVQTEEALRLSEALHRAMVETAQEGIMATSPQGLTIFANETVARILGRPVESLHGEDPLPILGLAPASTSTRRQEVAYLRPDGEERILEVTWSQLNSRDSRLGSLVMVSDVTDARRTEHTLRRQALHDPLTGLPNRHLFLDRLETAAARQHRSEGKGTAVLFLDLDAFKPVNDRYGHEVGDDLLREVADRLRTSVRAVDTVGRLGGDEFAVICEEADEEAAVRVASRILEAFEEPAVVEGRPQTLGISIGVALSPPYHVDELVRRADGAMYRAKQLGGRRLVVAGEDADPQPPPDSLPPTS